jgi:hypothetical protein
MVRTHRPQSSVRSAGARGSNRLVTRRGRPRKDSASQGPPPARSEWKGGAPNSRTESAARVQLPLAEGCIRKRPACSQTVGRSRRLSAGASGHAFSAGAAIGNWCRSSLLRPGSPTAVTLRTAGSSRVSLCGSAPTCGIGNARASRAPSSRNSAALVAAASSVAASARFCVLGGSARNADVQEGSGDSCAGREQFRQRKSA